jgi:hypothetical protein
VTRTPGAARHVRDGDHLGRTILRLFTWVMVGLFIGSVIGLAVGPL